ncbi:MAG TPA: hypothetical protein VGV39_04705 [Mesorhizobium sp.]|jgi:hypothetical protein|nr:hypothetical protein [Mesorhizobium sp.]HEV2502349.1 hypothetical protein [Mesorhizobium sp.]
MIRLLLTMAVNFGCTILYLWLGYDLHVPTFLFALGIVQLASAIRKGSA